MRTDLYRDEKVRAEDWPDILLEQWSDEDRRAPGWVQKPLACDYIAYSFAPSGVCYLLPVMPPNVLGAFVDANGSANMANVVLRTLATSPLVCPCGVDVGDRRRDDRRVRP